MQRLCDIRLVILAALLVVANCIFATSTDSAAACGHNNIKASLVITDAEETIENMFGRACIRIVCDSVGVDYAYNYEEEETEGNTRLFIAGELKMGMNAIPFEEYTASYIANGIGIYEYPLLLTDECKQRLWSLLEEQRKKGNCIAYDYAGRDCSCICLEFVKDAIAPDSIEYASWTKKQLRSRREMCYDFAHKNDPWKTWWMMTIVGNIVDDRGIPEENIIIPSELQEAWSTAKVNGEAMLGEKTTISESSNTYSKPFFTPILAAILLLIIWITGCFMGWECVDYAVLGVSTFIGAIVTFLVVCSKMPCTEWNWLIIAFNPLMAVFWQWRKYWATPYAIVELLWIAAMIVFPHRLVDPANIILAICVSAMLAKQGWIRWMR